jgi:hypothetical protein
MIKLEQRNIRGAIVSDSVSRKEGKRHGFFSDPKNFLQKPIKTWKETPRILCQGRNLSDCIIKQGKNISV